jgi:ubiquinone/menaquinone biosynthesis C-methylase UbiE
MANLLPCQNQMLSFGSQDLLQHVHQVFANDKFDEQPQFVIDTGCGDGHLLQCIYEHVKNHTPRGKVHRRMGDNGWTQALRGFP